MFNKKVMITGANSGMGLASAVKLASLGAHVIMVCRSEERGLKALEEAKAQSGSDSIELMLCDLGSLDSIVQFAEKFISQHDSLDVLINNAGVVSLKRQLTAHGFEYHMGINHLGHFLVTSLLLEPLKAADQGRIVNVSSGAYKVGKIHYDDPTLSRRYNVAKGYGQSKLANILFTKGLVETLKGTSVTANCLHPGAVATNIGVDRGTGFGQSLVGLLRPFFLTAEQGAETAIHLAVTDEVAGITGQYFYRKAIQELPDKAKNPAAVEAFWKWSEQQVASHLH